ncbi:hypothetical protein DEALK_06750 [Dehalogenimonas alkenigignens]|uniref:Uncharacterized protein n=1 Tax=Dehalogenimonas alkenigignens TaxID=1217799 RepID=A0A0W0GH00_9CHLR|nr:hypothetical protein [Dehalogenimonas alkenigignens]KTB47830.1 hypothetical protein DEALK_06750 [Dehalogenimonas alkenigignens]
MKTKDLLEQFEKTYRDEKLKEAEALHNAIAGLLSEHKAEIQTVLYVLDMVRFELLEERYRSLFAADAKPGEMRDGAPQ